MAPHFDDPVGLGDGKNEQAGQIVEFGPPCHVRKTLRQFDRVLANFKRGWQLL